jgi:hypothetical protein
LKGRADIAQYMERARECNCGANSATVLNTTSSHCEEPREGFAPAGPEQPGGAAGRSLPHARCSLPRAPNRRDGPAQLGDVVCRPTAREARPPQSGGHALTQSWKKIQRRQTSPRLFRHRMLLGGRGPADVLGNVGTAVTMGARDVCRIVFKKILIRHPGKCRTGGMRRGKAPKAVGDL